MTHRVQERQKEDAPKFCGICGQPFSSSLYNKKYCSEACKREAHRLQMAAHRAKNAWYARKKEAWTKPPDRAGDSLVDRWSAERKRGLTQLQYGAWVAENANARPVVTLPDWAEGGSKDGQNP